MSMNIREGIGDDFSGGRRCFWLFRLVQGGGASATPKAVSDVGVVNIVYLQVEVCGCPQGLVEAGEERPGHGGDSGGELI
jgi:hypothetical protein